MRDEGGSKRTYAQWELPIAQSNLSPLAQVLTNASLLPPGRRLSEHLLLVNIGREFIATVNIFMSDNTHFYSV